MIKSMVKYSILAAVAALTAFGVYERLKVSKAIDSIKCEGGALDGRLDDEINAKIEAYNSKQAAIVEKYKQKIDSCIRISFANARNGAEKFSGELGDLTYLLKLSYLFACDEVFQENSSEAEVGGKVSNYVSKHINEGLEKAESLMKDCYIELSGNHTKLRLDVDRLVGARPLCKDLKLRMKSLDETLASIQSETMVNSVRLSVTLAAEGIFIKDICKIALRLLRPVVAKMVVAAGSSLSDGPLPFGDMVGLAFTLWSVYDIYYIKVEAPESVRIALNEELDRQEAELMDKVGADLLALLEKFEQ